MKKIVQNIIPTILIILLSTFSINALIALDKPEGIHDTIEKKSKETQEAKLKADKARIEWKRAEDEYLAFSKQHADSNNETDKKALKKLEEFSIEAKTQFNTEKKKAESLEIELSNLSKLQKEAEAIESGFNESGSKNEYAEEMFESCIKNFLEKHLKNPPKSDLYKKLIDQLSAKLKELEVYERSNFYKSSTITNEQWQVIHNDALNDKGSYELKYKKLLQDIEQIKDSIAKLIKEKEENDFLPSSNETHECFAKNYLNLDKKLTKLEKEIEAENEDGSSPWN